MKNSKTTPLEHAEQCLYVDWLAAQHPRVWECMHAVPNQFSARNRQIQARLREGFSPGYPDILIDYPAHGFHGLRIEMKRVNGIPSQVSDTQRHWLNRLNEQGYFATWARGGDEAILITQNYLRGLVVSPDPWPTRTG